MNEKGEGKLSQTQAQKYEITVESHIFFFVLFSSLNNTSTVNPYLRYTKLSTRMGRAGRIRIVGGVGVGINSPSQPSPRLLDSDDVLIIPVMRLIVIPTDASVMIR